MSARGILTGGDGFSGNQSTGRLQVLGAERSAPTLSPGGQQGLPKEMSAELRSGGVGGASESQRPRERTEEMASQRPEGGVMNWRSAGSITSDGWSSE